MGVNLFVVYLRMLVQRKVGTVFEYGSKVPACFYCSSNLVGDEGPAGIVANTSHGTNKTSSTWLAGQSFSVCNLVITVITFIVVIIVVIIVVFIVVIVIIFELHLLMQPAP